MDDGVCCVCTRKATHFCKKCGRHFCDKCLGDNLCESSKAAKKKVLSTISA